MVVSCSTSPRLCQIGTVIDLVADDEGDDLTDEEGHALQFWMSCANGGEPRFESLLKLKRKSVKSKIGGVRIASLHRNYSYTN